jgi:hypothetical protein
MTQGTYQVFFRKTEMTKVKGHFMKHITLIFLFSLMTFLVGCQQSSSKKTSTSSSSAYCTSYPTSPGCPGYCTSNPTSSLCTGTTTGTTTSGSTGSDCTTGNNYWTVSTCAGYAYCQANPSYSYCTTTPNPYPYYGSSYTEKNWLVKYPYKPAENCSTPVAPAGISYTPYDTRKGTVTVIGAGFTNNQANYNPKSWYDPNTYTTISGDQTSALLRNVEDAKKFFWTDSALKIRFKANLQPDSSQANPICAGRVSGISTLKGYTKIKFNLYLVGTTSNGTTVEEFLGEQTLELLKCSAAINLSKFGDNNINYPSKYPEGIYLKIRDVRGNQDWSPGTQAELQAWDTWGFYPNTYYSGDSYMPAIRSNDCWSVDIEVAADGTKTF